MSKGDSPHQESSAGLASNPTTPASKYAGATDHLVAQGQLQNNGPQKSKWIRVLTGPPRGSQVVGEKMIKLHWKLI